MRVGSGQDNDVSALPAKTTRYLGLGSCSRQVKPTPAGFYAKYAQVNVAARLVLLPLTAACHAACRTSPLLPPAPPAAAQRSPRVGIALEVFMLPYLCISTQMPQATLLYWLSNSAFFLGLQHALAQPRIAAALGLPAVMLPHPQHDKEARGAHPWGWGLGFYRAVCSGSVLVVCHVPRLR